MRGRFRAAGCFFADVAAQRRRGGGRGALRGQCCLVRVVVLAHCWVHALSSLWAACNTETLTIQSVVLLYIHYWNAVVLY